MKIMLSQEEIIQILQDYVVENVVGAIAATVINTYDITADIKVQVVDTLETEDSDIPF